MHEESCLWAAARRSAASRTRIRRTGGRARVQLRLLLLYTTRNRSRATCARVSSTPRRRAPSRDDAGRARLRVRAAVFLLMLLFFFFWLYPIDGDELGTKKRAWKKPLRQPARRTHVPRADKEPEHATKTEGGRPVPGASHRLVYTSSFSRESFTKLPPPSISKQINTHTRFTGTRREDRNNISYITFRFAIV